MFSLKGSGAVGVAMLMAALSGCVVAPPPRARVVQPAEPAPVRDVYIYPNNGQSAEQTDRDRYECHLWAVKQTHFDPSMVSAGQAPRVTVVAPPPGANTAAGAITGAVIGAAVSNPHNGPGGALIGAVAGAMIGAAADQQNQQQAEEAQRQYDRSYEAQARPAENYRRALSACLEGRGYTVK
ncbi:MAG: glycine zipper 2TM domain-containing protein [Steroidobacter sp.]